MNATMLNHRRTKPRQCGATVVEFAIVIVVFLTFVFGIMEMGRALYVFNILQEVTRRAAQLAAVTDFSNKPALTALRKSAVFDETSGQLILGAPVTEAHVRIDYLAITRDAGGGLVQTEIPEASLPASTARNRYNCLLNPYGASCIRLVRVRICDPADGGACNAVAYQPIFPLVSFTLNLPKATTIGPVESLGFTSGTAP